MEPKQLLAPSHVVGTLVNKIASTSAAAHQEDQLENGVHEKYNCSAYGSRPNFECEVFIFKMTVFILYRVR